jgi:hypothetical protein
MIYNPKIGDILNFSWISKGDRLVKTHNYLMYGFSRKNKWTHSAIIGDMIGKDIIVYEALYEGFVKRVYSIEELNIYISNGNMTVGRTKKILTNVKENCEKYLGTPYGYTDIFSIILYTLFGKSSFKLSTNTKKLICSEAVARIIYDSSGKKINFEKEFNKRYDLITPIDLYKSRYIRWRSCF